VRANWIRDNKSGSDIAYLLESNILDVERLFGLACAFFRRGLRCQLGERLAPQYFHHRCLRLYPYLVRAAPAVLVAALPTHQPHVQRDRTVHCLDDVHQGNLPGIRNQDKSAIDPASGSPRPYTGLPDIDYPLHDKTIVVTRCGRICLGKKKINFSQVFGGQAPWASKKCTMTFGW